MIKRQNPNITKDMFKLIGSLALVMGLFLMTALPAVAAEETQYDDVFINGYKLGFFEQMALEDHIDRDIEDGNYWFEMETGMWGPVGGEAIGHIEVPEDYQDYVKSKLSNTTQATKVEFSASAEECQSDCLYW
jgi:hypothetical protein